MIRKTVTYHKWCGKSFKQRAGSPFPVPPYLCMELKRKVIRNVSRFRLRAHDLKFNLESGLKDQTVMLNHCHCTFTVLEAGATCHGRLTNPSLGWRTKVVLLRPCQHTRPNSPELQNPCIKGPCPSACCTHRAAESCCTPVLAWLQRTENGRVRASVHQVCVTSEIQVSLAHGQG